MRFSLSLSFDHYVTTGILEFLSTFETMLYALLPNPVSTTRVSILQFVGFMTGVLGSDQLPR